VLVELSTKRELIPEDPRRSGATRRCSSQTSREVRNERKYGTERNWEARHERGKYGEGKKSE